MTTTKEHSKKGRVSVKHIREEVFALIRQDENFRDFLKKRFRKDGDTVKQWGYNRSHATLFGYDYVLAIAEYTGWKEDEIFLPKEERIY